MAANDTSKGRTLSPHQRHQLGNTDIFVSPISFGAGPLGNEYGRVEETEGIKAVIEAVKRGINLFDVSPYYGRLKAETVLGKALRKLPRDSFVLSTKVGRYDVDTFDFSAERVTRSVEESMERLGVDYIDIILCHDIEFGDMDMVATETIPALCKLKQEGKVRAVGFSGYPLEIFPYILSVVEPGNIDVVLSYCHYNLQNDRLSLLLESLKRQGVGVISASPLSMGLLTPSGPPAWHPADSETREISQQAVKLCEEHGTDLPTVALQYALQADPAAISTTLIGIDSVKTLEKNLAVLEMEPNMKVIEEVRNVFEPVRNRRWSSGRFLGSTVENKESLEK